MISSYVMILAELGPVCYNFSLICLKTLDLGWQIESGKGYRQGIGLLHAASQCSVPKSKTLQNFPAPQLSPKAWRALHLNTWLRWRCWAHAPRLCTYRSM